MCSLTPQVCKRFQIPTEQNPCVTPKELLKYLASSNLLGLSKASRELPTMRTIAPCKHLAQVQPLETLAFAGFVSKRDHHLKQTCINLWDETLQFVKTAGLEADPAGKDKDYNGLLKEMLETMDTYGAGENAEVAKNLFKLSYTKGLKDTLPAPLPIFPAGFDNSVGAWEKDYFLHLYDTKELQTHREKIVDVDGQTYDERLVSDSNLFASQCVQGFMAGPSAMVQTPYPIFPPPAYSWAHAAQYICEKQACTLIPPKLTQYMQNIPLGKPKDNETRHIVAKEMRLSLPECIKLHNSRHPASPCTKGLFVTITFPPNYIILETWMRAGHILAHLNTIFQESLQKGFCQQTLVFAAVGVEMHRGETQDQMKKGMADGIIEEHARTLQEAGLTQDELTEILDKESPQAKDELLKCMDHTKVATLLYRRAERGTLVGAAHMHITVLYSGSRDILEAECVRALQLPKVYVDIKQMPAQGLDALPEAGLPPGKKWTRSDITAFERRLLKHKGNAIVYTAYTLKEIHNKHTRLFATQIGGIGNTVHIFATKDFLRATTTPPSANNKGSLFIIAIDTVYKEDSDGPGFLCCQCTPGAQEGNELYGSAEKGGVFGTMDVEGTVNAQFPSIQMDSASTQLTFEPDQVILAQQNEMAAIGNMRVGVTSKVMMVIAVRVTSEVRQYLIENFLTQTMEQRLCIVAQIMEENFHHKSIFSIVLYHGVLNPGDFTPSNLSTLHMQVGNIREKMWDGKKIVDGWVKPEFTKMHEAIQASTKKDKFLMHIQGDRLQLKSNEVAVITDFMGGKTQHMPNEYPLKCQNMAGVGQVPIQKSTLHAGATIWQNEDVDKAIFQGVSPRIGPAIEYRGKCVASFYGDQDPKAGMPTRVWHALVSYPIYSKNTPL